MLTRLLGLLLVLTLTLGALPSGRADSLQLPSIGSSDAGLISPELERRIGELFMRQLRHSTAVLDDPEFTQYIQGLGYRLAANSAKPQQPFRFFVVDNSVINAFAGPGGNIGMHSGLILLTESEAELASVMAHEIAHVTQRHLPRMFEQQKRMSIPTLAAMVGALVLGAVDPDAGVAAITAVQAGSVQMQIDFTRANEEEADRVGLGMLYQSGFEPRAMPRFFERMQEAARFSAGNSIPEFLRTHPLTQSRIVDTRNRADAYPLRQQEPDKERYQHIRARLQVNAAPYATDAIRQFEDAIAASKTPQGEALARYGLAYAYLRGGRTDDARSALAPLVNRSPARLTYYLAAARIEMAARDFAGALRHLDAAEKLFPGDITLTYLRGEAELLAGNPLQARRYLNDYVLRDDANPRAFEMLARAASDSGRLVEAHQMQAEYHYRMGNIDEALRQLRLASKLPGVSFIEVSQIESRLRYFEHELELREQLF